LENIIFANGIRIAFQIESWRYLIIDSQLKDMAISSIVSLLILQADHLMLCLRRKVNYRIQMMESSFCHASIFFL